MPFDWERAAGAALIGVGGQMTNNYERYKDEQAQIAKESRLYETQMKKEQELMRMQNQAEVNKRNAAADAMEASGNYSKEEIDAARAGIKPSVAWQQEQEITGAQAQAEAGVQGKLNAIRNDPTLTPEQKEQAIAQQLGIGKTAAERNEAKVMGIIGDKSLEQLTDNDKLRLATYGIKIPGLQRKELSDTVMKDVWKTTRTEAQEAYSPDAMGDAQAINEANALLQSAGKKHQVKTASQARQLLIDNAATGGYIRGIAMLTGQMPGSTPDGATITPEQAEEAIAEGGAPGMPDAPEAPQSDKFGALSSLRMEGPPEPPRGIDAVRQKRAERTQRRQGPGGQAVPGLSEYSMPKSVPQVGTTTLPQEPEGAMAGPGGDTRVDDIIGRMRR